MDATGPAPAASGRPGGGQAGGGAGGGMDFGADFGEGGDDTFADFDADFADEMGGRMGGGLGGSSSGTGSALPTASSFTSFDGMDGDFGSAQGGGGGSDAFASFDAAPAAPAPPPLAPSRVASGLHAPPAPSASDLGAVARLEARLASLEEAMRSGGSASGGTGSGQSSIEQEQKLAALSALVERRLGGVKKGMEALHGRLQAVELAMAKLPEHLKGFRAKNKEVRAMAPTLPPFAAL